jgi:NADH-quinone oxidoreductase subunit M
MSFIQAHLLSLILFLPALSAVIVLLIPRENQSGLRWVSLLASLVPLALAIGLWFGYNPAQPGFQFVEEAPWYTAIHANYHLGADGISAVLVLLTTLLVPLAIIVSWNESRNLRTHLALLLLLETGMLGVFMSLDLLMFFVFWEVGLVPIYFLIDQWGGENRQRAAFKFLIYTMGGSLGLLLAIQLIGVVSGTFDIVTISQNWAALKEPLTVLGLPITIPISTVKAIAFWAFVIAFAIKIPIWPFHTWLPDAYTEAPTAGSMLLAGVMAKLGAYGFLRLVLPLYPQEAQSYAWILALLATLSILFGALSAWGQRDLKRLVAYSSVNHMGWVVLGIAAAAYARGTMSAPDAVWAMNGAVLQMFNHGVSTAGMFLLVGVIYERTRTRKLDDLGGLFPLMPIYGGLFIFTAMAWVGLPGLNGFVSEFLVVRGVWPIFTLFTAVSMFGLLVTGAYVLKGIRGVLHGPVNKAWAGVPLEISRREVVAMSPLLVLMLAVGVWPSWILNVINQTVLRLFG